MNEQLESVSNKGERILESDRIELVEAHRARYLFAKKFIRVNSKVLDCACGSGYGTAILATASYSVLGMDISDAAINFARSQYKRPNLSFEKGSALAIPLDSNSIDVFCSFETIEHVPEPLALVSEAKRVLKSGGVFLVSTPNRLFSNLGPNEKPENPFHLFEWSFQEFHRALSTEFKQIDIYGQRFRSRNKLAISYVRSKLYRKLKRLDFAPIPIHSKVLARLETRSGSYPENFVAVCNKN